MISYATLIYSRSLFCAKFQSNMATHLYPKGRCAEGKKCKFPSLWLRPQDKCPDCSRIVHPLCGVLTEAQDKYRCQSCAATHFGSQSITATTVTQTDSHDVDRKDDGSVADRNESTAGAVACTEIVISPSEKSGTVVSGITDEKDTSNYTAIPKDYFITSDQNLNTDCKKRDGDIWSTIKKAV